MMRRILFVIPLLCCVLAANASALTPDDGPGSRPAPSAAGIRIALLYPQEIMSPVNAGTGSLSSSRTRSIPLAFGLSALVPGAGQVYNRQLVKAVLSIVVEGALATGYLVSRRKGLDAEDAYKLYAHSYWSPVQYADWLGDYVVYLNENYAGSITTPPALVPDGIDFQQPETWSQNDVLAVRGFFDQIRAIEGKVFHPETGASFSHKLPYFAEQQYYELIGKYFQFAPGWEDYPVWKDGETFTDAIDPERTGPDGSKPNIQGRFLEYASDHAHSNDLLRRASRLSAFIILNHLVSAIDAAVFAKIHNDRLATDFSVRPDALGEIQTFVSVRYKF